MAADNVLLTEIVKGILLLGARVGEQIPVPKVHSILWGMRSSEKILAGLWFSITGAICYSRQVETAMKELAAQGVLHLDGDSTAVVKSVQGRHGWFLRIFPGKQYHSVHRVSRLFHQRLNGEEWGRPPR